MRDYANAPGVSASLPKYTPVEVQGRTLRNELARLANHRTRTGAGIGHQWSWLETAADVAAAIYGANLTARNVEGVCTRIGLPAQSATVYPPLAARASHARRSAGPDDLALLDPEMIGQRLELTAEERQGLDIRRIGSFNETPRERQLRHDRERAAERRAANGATPRSKSKAARKPWEALGISQSTYYARGLHRVGNETSGLS